MRNDGIGPGGGDHFSKPYSSDWCPGPSSLGSTSIACLVATHSTDSRHAARILPTSTTTISEMHRPLHACDE